MRATRGGGIRSSIATFPAHDGGVTAAYWYGELAPKQGA